MFRCTLPTHPKNDIYFSFWFCFHKDKEMALLGGFGWARGGVGGEGFHSSWPQHDGSHCPQLGPSHHPLTGHKWKRGFLIKPAHSLSELLEASRAWGHVHGRPTFSMGHEAQLGFTLQGEQFKRRKPSRYNGHKPHTPKLSLGQLENETGRQGGNMSCEEQRPSGAHFQAHTSSINI